MSVGLRRAQLAMRADWLELKGGLAMSRVRLANVDAELYLEQVLGAERDWFRNVGQWAMVRRMQAALIPGYTEKAALLEAGWVIRHRHQLDWTLEEAAYVAAEILAGYASRRQGRLVP